MTYFKLNNLIKENVSLEALIVKDSNFKLESNLIYSELNTLFTEYSNLSYLSSCYIDQQDKGIMVIKELFNVESSLEAFSKAAEKFKEFLKKSGEYIKTFFQWLNDVFTLSLKNVIVILTAVKELLTDKNKLENIKKNIPTKGPAVLTIVNFINVHKDALATLTHEFDIIKSCTTAGDITKVQAAQQVIASITPKLQDPITKLDSEKDDASGMDLTVGKWLDPSFITKLIDTLKSLDALLVNTKKIKSSGTTILKDLDNTPETDTKPLRDLKSTLIKEHFIKDIKNYLAAIQQQVGYIGKIGKTILKQANK